MNTVDFKGRPFHFLGIGGIGMSALAYILAKRQIPVSGSDLKKSHITERLESLNVRVFKEQTAHNLTLLTQEQNFVPQVVVSTAISRENEEYQAALASNCPIYHRSDILAALIKDYHSIAVAGTHGKTTTSSLISHVLLQAGIDPTVIIGGEIEGIAGNAYLGKSQYMVAEADESDGSLVKHCPKIGIITNIELDHPDHYDNLGQVVDIFRTFVDNSETLIGCVDCDTVRQSFKPDITYSLNPASHADYLAQNIRYHGKGSQADIWENGQKLGTIELKLLGDHNISNALAAIAVARQLGLDFNLIAQGMTTFTGAKRRFEWRGESHGVTFIDDYAHHPTELEVTLASARQKLQNSEFSRIIAIFQPHRYTRTTAFLAEFATAFKDADLVVITDIYGASESNPHQLSGQVVADAIRENHEKVYYQPSLSELPEFLAEILETGDLTLFLGAGNLNQKIPETILAYTNACVLNLAQAG